MLISKSIFAFQFSNMKKTTIAVFFSIMFAALTVAPDIIVLMDIDYDVTVILESSEEEERKGEEKVKDFEIEILSSTFLDSDFSINEKQKLLSFHINNYSSIFKELTSPPLEGNIL